MSLEFGYLTDSDVPATEQHSQSLALVDKEKENRGNRQLRKTISDSLNGLLKYQTSRKPTLCFKSPLEIPACQPAVLQLSTSNTSET